MLTGIYLVGEDDKHESPISGNPPFSAEIAVSWKWIMSVETPRPFLRRGCGRVGSIDAVDGCETLHHQKDA